MLTRSYIWWISRRKIMIILPVIVILMVLVVAFSVMTGTFSVLGKVSNTIKGKTIVIDPGHGGPDPGAVVGQLFEKDINLEVAKKLERLLLKEGAKVVMTRTGDENFASQKVGGRKNRQRRDLKGRVEVVEDQEADLFISIHANKGRRKAAYGMETYYHPLSPKGEALANEIQKQLTSVQKDNKRQAKTGNYYLLRNTKIPAVIVEVGFLSNSRERQMLQESKYKELIARAIHKGIDNFAKSGGFNLAEQTTTLAETENTSETIDWMRIYLPRMNPTGEAILAPKLVNLAKVTLGQNKPDNKLDLASWTLASLLEKTRQEAGLFPKGVSVNSLSIRGNLARVDFSKELGDVEGLEAEQLVVASIVKTLTQIQGITQVSITVEGEQLETLQGHVAINEPLTGAQVGKTPKIAVVIDDFGGDVAGVKDMYTFKYPLTIAIMPHLEFSRQQAEKAKQEGFQVILHLPMEPTQGKSYWLGPGAITTRMSVEEVRKSVLADLAEIPQATGFNNHMGSKATADKRIMEAVLQIAKEKKLFVLDSRTTQKTVIPELAAEIGIPIVHRSIFLDNVNSTAHIRRQMEKAMEEAKAKGSAVVIGHVGPTGPKVVEVLRQLLPQLEEQGIEMVFVSELAKKPAP